jgi:uncharacterized protein
MTAYLLIDGENIDTTLGSSILGGRPSPDERPRWERLLDFVKSRGDTEVTALFFISVHGEHLPMPFIQALTAIGYTPIPLSGPSDAKVVDIAILRTLDALLDRPGDVVLASHDGDFLPQVSQLVRDGRRVAIVGFREFMNAGYAELTPHGLELVDMEYDAGVFTYRLPRIRVIPIDEYDPLQFL